MEGTERAIVCRSCPQIITNLAEPCPRCDGRDHIQSPVVEAQGAMGDGRNRTLRWDEKYCDSCGTVVRDIDTFCTQCGFQFAPVYVDGKSKWVAGLLAIVLGFVCTHKLYLQQPIRRKLLINVSWVLIAVITSCDVSDFDKPGYDSNAEHDKIYESYEALAPGAEIRTFSRYSDYREFLAVPDPDYLNCAYINPRGDCDPDRPRFLNMAIHRYPLPPDAAKGEPYTTIGWMIALLAFTPFVVSAVVGVRYILTPDDLFRRRHPESANGLPGSEPLHDPLAWLMPRGPLLLVLLLAVSILVVRLLRFTF